jgi:hypothetical protein
MITTSFDTKQPPLLLQQTAHAQAQGTAAWSAERSLSYSTVLGAEWCSYRSESARPRRVYRRWPLPPYHPRHLSAAVRAGLLFRWQLYIRNRQVLAMRIMGEAGAAALRRPDLASFVLLRSGCVGPDRPRSSIIPLHRPCMHYTAALLIWRKGPRGNPPAPDGPPHRVPRVGAGDTVTVCVRVCA